MMNKATFSTVLALFLCIASTAQAQYTYEQPSPSSSIVIDKTVGKPGVATKGGTVSVEYVQNLSSTDYKFAPGADVWFRLAVKNTSNQALTNVTVKDYLPAYLEPVEGAGTFDKNSNTITIDAGNFAVSEEKVYELKTRVKPQSSLPADKGLFCVTNNSEAYTDKVKDDDAAGLCIEKQVTLKGGTPEVPKAGAELSLIITALSTAAGFAGLKLRKVS